MQMKYNILLVSLSVKQTWNWLLHFINQKKYLISLQLECEGNSFNNGFWKFGY